jgi:hypothetical protein
VSLNTASAALAHYKELIAISKRVKEAATQPDKLLDEEDDEEDNKEDSASSNEEALDEDFNPPTRGYISLLSNQLPNTP